MALVKDTFCKFRLSSAQKAQIKQMATDRDLSEGELILRALGLEGGDPSSLPAAATDGRKADPKKEPGRAGIEELAGRMAKGKKK